MLLLVAILIGLSAKADYTVQTYEPFYPNPAQPYYNQNYYANPYQAQYQTETANPYLYQQQCVNPYLNRRYGYPGYLPYSTLNGTTTGGAQGIVKNIGQSLLYSIMRGY